MVALMISPGKCGIDWMHDSRPVFQAFVGRCQMAEFRVLHPRPHDFSHSHRALVTGKTRTRKTPAGAQDTSAMAVAVIRRSAPRARVKPAAPMRVEPGLWAQTLVSRRQRCSPICKRSIGAQYAAWK
jgi:hypothetical protein